MAVVKRFVATINFYKKLCLPVITWNRKHLSKQVLPITCNMEKMVFAVTATYEGL